MVYLDLCSLARDAKHKNIKFVVGGDFNTYFGRGLRGDMLADFLNEFNLKSTCSCDTDIQSNSIFQSSMGFRCQIDFIFYLCNCTVEEASAINYLDLGSDHRAVKSKFLLELRSNQKRRKRVKKGWKPKLNSQREASEYHIQLQQQISDNQLI